MSHKIIKKITEKEKGIFVIDVDKEKASQIKGSNYSERLNNAIRDFRKGGQDIRRSNPANR